MPVEPYHPDLFQEFIGLARAMHAESTEREGDFDPDKVRRNLEMAGIFAALYRAAGDECIGFFVGTLDRAQWGSDVTAADIAIYVKPECRGSLAGVRLIRAFEDWAIANGARRIFLAQATAIDIPKTTKLFEKLGYQVVGAVTRKEIR